MKKKRYAAVGIGGRIPMFIDPLVSRFRNEAELVGLCDTSLVRMQHHQQRLTGQFQCRQLPMYQDFDRMLREEKPDCVIVCTPDYLHHSFIVRSLDAGADVISEKPLTIDAEKCLEIFQAVDRSGRQVRTTFNLRWSPGISKVRELIAAGTIGTIRHVDFEYMLNTSHGADYFRRWHSYRKFSGGLLLHKSTHHFDVINWWLDGIPELVFAMGGLEFYGKENALRRGDERWTTYPRYTGYAAAATDPFRLDLEADDDLKSLYHDAEAESGYVRDENVFREGIDIEDSMSLLIRYRTGTMVCYSLNAFSPCEGFRASITGDRGRIEYSERFGSHLITGNGEPPAGPQDYSCRLTVQLHFSAEEEIDIPRSAGGHGGADPLLQEQLFSSKPPPDHLGRSAGHEQGAASVLIGAAANLSMEKTAPIRISDLLNLKPAATRLSELC